MNRVLKDAGYIRLKDRLIASTGLAFYANRDELLAELIGKRLSALGLRGCSPYADFLADGEKGSAEMDVLIAQLTVGETYFFRDESQFAAIRDVILPDILDRNKASRQLRIWSAGCATGAEPYSLAILLAHQLTDRIADWRIEICATDLNRDYLAQAAEGKFRAWALRAISDELKCECFSKTGLGWTILPRYKQWISFHRTNLAATEFSPPFSTDAHFDLILCCNVMIYFTPAVNQRLAARFHHSLRDGGWLVVGACEHRQKYRAFRTVDANGARFYQKTSLPCGAPLSPVAMAAPAEPGSARSGAVASAGHNRVSDQRHDHKAAVSRDHGAGAACIEHFRRLADCGDWEGAAEYGWKLLAQDRLNPAVHFYQALVFENLGRAGEMERSLRQAIYLDRNFALAHYHLGLALKRDRQTIAAARSFENVLQVLAGVPDGAAVAAAPGVTVTDLKQLAKMHLESVEAS